MDRKKALTDCVDLLANIVRVIYLRRTLHTICPEPPLNFWRIIYGNLTDIAVLEWCKLFGADDDQNQPVHWKNLTTDADQFRKEMFSTLDIYESKWKSYWAEMKRYRDQSVAHHDFRRVQIKTYPQFDLALESSYFYYGYVVSELTKYGINQQPKDLRAYGRDFANQSHDIATAALEATKSFSEQVR
jgi:hypothetical protein